MATREQQAADQRDAGDPPHHAELDTATAVAVASRLSWVAGGTASSVVRSGARGKPQREDEPDDGDGRGGEEDGPDRRRCRLPHGAWRRPQAGPDLVGPLEQST